MQRSPQETRTLYTREAEIRLLVNMYSINKIRLKEYPRAFLILLTILYYPAFSFGKFAFMFSTYSSNGKPST